MQLPTLKRTTNWIQKGEHMQQQSITADERFRGLSNRQPPEIYNFKHFRTRHIVEDTVRTWQRQGIQPGEHAPDFELPAAGGNSLRLSSLQGRPTVLHFGSYT